MAASRKQPEETRTALSKEMSSPIVELASNQELQSLLQELAEIGVDSVMQDGILKDVPLIGTLVDLAKTGRNVRDLLFMRKLQSFLSSMQDTPNAARDEFKERMEGDQELRRRVGENLLLRLERMDDMSKPEILGRAFMWLMERRVTYDEYCLLEIAIDRVALPDLKELAAVSDASSIGTRLSEKEGISYELTRTGKLLQRIVLEVFNQSTARTGFSDTLTFELAQSLAANHLAVIVFTSSEGQLRKTLRSLGATSI